MYLFMQKFSYRLCSWKSSNGSFLRMVLLDGLNIQAIARLIYQATIPFCQANNLALGSSNSLHTEERMRVLLLVNLGTCKQAAYCRPPILRGLLYSQWLWTENHDIRSFYWQVYPSWISFMFIIKCHPLCLSSPSSPFIQLVVILTSIVWRPTLPNPWTMKVLPATPRGMFNLDIHACVRDSQLLRKGPTNWCTVTSKDAHL